jgi:tetratricopeptide (TPR) repeat protein
LDSTLLDTRADWAGIILYENQLEEAREAWEEVLLKKPRHLLALQGLGVVSLLEEDPTLALLYLDAARYVDPEAPATRLFIGLALEALDRPAEAVAEYQYIVDMGSDSELHSLASTLLQVLQE